jgi:hypothetical protein
VDENAYGWVKPWNFAKLYFGRFTDSTLRGKYSDNSDFGVFVLPQNDGDWIFTRFREKSGFGLTLTPFEGFFAGATVSTNIPDYGYKNTQATEPYDSIDVYKTVQAAVGYTIPDVGLARVQFINKGAAQENDDNQGWGRRIEAAFAFTGESAFAVDIGGKIPLEEKHPWNVSLGARITGTAPFSIWGKFDCKFPDGADPFITVFTQTSYDFTSLILGFDAGYSHDFETGKADTVGFGLWVSRPLDIGNIKTGMAFNLPLGKSPIISLPIIYNFYI